jgi:hypothetical protein
METVEFASVKRLGLLTQSGNAFLPTGWALLIGIIKILCIDKVVYGLFYNPLRHLPGPPFTAFCGWHEFYWNIFFNGHSVKHTPGYINNIVNLIESPLCNDMFSIDAYTPIMRAGPNHVHIGGIDIYEK